MVGVSRKDRPHSARWGESMDKFEELQEYNKLLEAVELIQMFLEKGDGCESQWWDENGEVVMGTDVGYFFEGLSQIEEYCERKGAI